MSLGMFSLIASRRRPMALIAFASLMAGACGTHADETTQRPVGSRSIAAAMTGAALQALLDKDPLQKGEIAARAEALGLVLVRLDVGTGDRRVDTLLIAGGGKPFSDCEAQETCPEMVIVPSSPPGFKIGSPEDEEGRDDDEAQHEISIRAFAIGRSEVTVQQYMGCVVVKRCRPPEWLEPGSPNNIETGIGSYYKHLKEPVSDERQPVVGVSWHDAADYARWLAETTGKPYRLPSEAEWEFATRAGTSTAYWWGSDVRQGGAVWANCAGCGSAWDLRGPAPVNMFPANAWGLHDAHGNVWEWVADVYCASYRAGPAGGRPQTGTSCSESGANELRVMRGGSSFYDARFLRSAVRVRNRPEFRNSSVGFRVVRSLPS